MSPRLFSGAARLAGSSLLRLQTDERLVALARSGHAPAFAAIVERYRDELLRYAERLVGPSRAEDVLQQAFLSAHLAMPSIADNLKLRAWLYRITHNVALNVLRAARPQAALDDTLVAPAAAIHDDFEVRERLRAALEAIARLPEPQRAALTLQAIEGRSHEEVAAALGLTAGAARQSVYRARTTVRAAVSAITPYGLVARFAMAGSGSSVSATDLAAGGAGAAGVATKAAAALLAAGAVAGGATQLPPVSHHHAAHRSQAREAAVAAPAPAGASATRAPVTHGPAIDDHRRNRGRNRRRADAGADRSRHHTGENEFGDDHRGSGTSGRSGSDDGSRSGSGDDRLGSSGPGSGSGEVVGSHSGESTSGGDDRLTSGTSGSDDGGLSSSSPGPAGTAPLTLLDGSRGSGESGSSGSDGGSSGSGSGGTDDSLSGSHSGSSGLDG